MNQNIVLIGMSGCGKTSVGTNLSCMLKTAFYDSDAEIKHYSKKDISEIFAEYGEAYFRVLETEILEKLSKKQGCIISTGGGCVKNQINIEYLKSNGIIVYLKSSPEKIMSNLLKDNSRPLLSSGDNSYEDKLAKIKGLYAERAKLYENAADIIIDVTGLDIKQSAKYIYDSLKL